MTDYGPTDGQIEQILKARWHAIGLSQADLAEVLDVAFRRTPQNCSGSNPADGDRRLQIAEAFDIPFEFLHGQPSCTGQEAGDLSPVPAQGSLLSFLGLRLLRAFHELRDDRTRRMLVHLAERIVRRQNGPSGDAG